MLGGMKTALRSLAYLASALVTGTLGFALLLAGWLVVVPGAGHSTQSRSASDVSRTSVATFLNG